VPASTTLATLRGPVPGYSGPAAVGPAQIVAPTWGAAVTLPVVARRTHWLEVRTIGRPNGQTAWIPAADVSLTRTRYYILVDLSRKHLLLFWEGKLRLYAPAGVGAPQTPTPVGRYFVAFFTLSPNPGYGPFVIVTSGLASTISDWEEKGTPVITVNGPLYSAALIASHGGAAVSQGSVRLLDNDLQRLRPVPAGTPIDVVSTVTPTRPQEPSRAP
jgi:L,D-transpeptidase catalytic domain